MSTSIFDIKTQETISHCCGASVYTDISICSDCQEPCGEVCALCEGEGFAEDANGETRTCPCVKEKVAEKKGEMLSDLERGN